MSILMDIYHCKPMTMTCPFNEITLLRQSKWVHVLYFGYLTLFSAFVFLLCFFVIWFQDYCVALSQMLHKILQISQAPLWGSSDLLELYLLGLLTEIKYSICSYQLISSSYWMVQLTSELFILIGLLGVGWDLILVVERAINPTS